MDADWQPIETAPKDQFIFVYAAPYLGWNDQVMDLPGFVSLCLWHPDAGFCVDELRRATMWCPIIYPPIPSTDGDTALVSSPASAVNLAGPAAQSAGPVLFEDDATRAKR
jgi:hypothetical protein